MFNQYVGIRSLAVSLPREIRTNDYYRENYPKLVEEAEKLGLARIFVPEESTSNQVDIYTEEMLPYLSDPFRGSVERRVVDREENALTLGYRAAYQALEAANLTAEEIDLAIVNTTLPKGVITGDAAFFARELGLKCPAWNIESGCSAAMVALQTAYAQVRSGECRNVLVITSAAFSDFLSPNDTLAFILGDGASAFIVSEVNTNCGVIGKKIFNAGESWGALDNHFILDKQGKVQIEFQPTDKASTQTVHNQLFYPCCQGAAAAAGVTLDQIDFFAFHTLAAWIAKASTRSLGVDFARTVDLYPYVGHIGSVTALINLYFAAKAGRIRENNLVLLYTIGYAGNAGAIVMRWGDVALGSLPENSEKILQAACSQPPVAVAV